MKNLPGSLAHDFQFVTKEGACETLHHLETNGEILLMFYDPDCDHCTQTIDTLIKSPLPGDITVIAIDIMEDRDLWEKTKGEMPGNWITGFALDPILDDETYILDEMPALYLLDRNKKIILKDATLSDLSIHFSQTTAP